VSRNTTKKLFHGDNLDILQACIESESIDLIYLDPPFNSKKIYNASVNDAQIKAFDDIWYWTDQTSKLLDNLERRISGLYEQLMIIRKEIGENGMSAYLVMMAARLVELNRVLKATGSLYLHCDPTASHYLKIIMDFIFGFKNFRHQIVWKRTSAHNDSKGWGHIQDNILFYSKSDEYVWNKVYTGYDQNYVAKFYRHTDDDGRRFQAGDLTAAGISKGGDSGKPWRGIDPGKKGNHWAIRRSFLNDPNIPENTHKALDYLDAIGRIYWPPNGQIPRIKRYLDEMPGGPIQEIITDIPPLSAKSKEKLGYQTQKPLALLERIIAASSNKGDTVLDPFCGSGTTIEAAEKLQRKWIGIDIAHLAIALTEKRLAGGYKNLKWETIALPKEIKTLGS
jgi:site-specific DNA-methyltransferase (adenine-specific)